MLLTKNEEDYVKALFYLIVESGQTTAGTNQLADYLNLAPASVNGMLKKLKAKELVVYEKYGKLQLSKSGRKIAIKMIRQHRLWETFLCNQLNFKWEEVHEVAEQLEHIKSEKLVNELDKYLGYPKRDPHGAAIPSTNGEYHYIEKKTLSEMTKGGRCKLIGVKDSSAPLLKYITQIGLALGSELFIKEIREFDNTFVLEFEGSEEVVSQKFASNVFVDQH